MRVIAGTCRGRTLRAPDGTGTRPTGDRVREAIFDILGSLMSLDDLAVLDLYAGSGALGIEALSRGAARAVFVDQAPAALAAVRANLEALGFQDSGRVVRGDALAFVARGEPFDLALCDPPYDFDQWSELLGSLEADVAVLESNRPLSLPAPWAIMREKRYGGTLVTVASRSSRDPAGQKGTQ